MRIIVILSLIVLTFSSATKPKKSIKGYWELYRIGYPEKIKDKRSKWFEFKAMGRMVLGNLGEEAKKKHGHWNMTSDGTEVKLKFGRKNDENGVFQIMLLTDSQLVLEANGTKLFFDR